MPHFFEAIDRTGRFTNRLAAWCEDDEVTPSSFHSDVVHRFPNGRLRWARDLKLRRRLEELIRESAVVHIHGLWREYSGLTAGLCRKLGKPYLVSAHGMLQPWTLANRRWKKRIYMAAVERPFLRGAVGLRALTCAEIADYQRIGLSNSIKVVPNGVDVPESISPQLFYETFPHLADLRLVLFLGRIHPKKGIDILCRSWAHIEKEYPNAHLVIAGPDEDNTLATLQDLVRKSGIESRVTFTGLLRGPVKWSALAASSLFVLPSHSEGFSVSILEALGSGLPVLVSRNCNFPEITDARCGWEIDPEEDQLTNSLRTALAQGPDILARIGNNGRQLIADNYTWGAIGSRAADMLDEWSGNPSRQSSPADATQCRP